MKTILDFLDGKKTILGFMILWLSDKIWFLNIFPEDSLGMIKDICTYLGGALAGTGLVHKGYKVYEEKKELKEDHPLD